MAIYYYLIEQISVLLLQEQKYKCDFYQELFDEWTLFLSLPPSVKTKKLLQISMRIVKARVKVSVNKTEKNHVYVK